MIIESLELKNYRNYKNLHIDFDEGINLLYGDNAQGKTNILEAVYMSASAKSHRGSKDRELIGFGEEDAHIKAEFKKSYSSYKIDMHLKKNKAKGIAVNGIPIRKLSELFGIANIVFFSPEDLNIIKNGPSERRRFIDLELCQLNKLYMNNLIAYNRILMQRNKLLKELGFHSDWKDTLDIWDEQLVRYGSELIKMRADFTERLNKIIYGIHLSISGGREHISVVYDSNISVENYYEAVKKSRETDIKLRITNTGPHRDDIGFFIKSENLLESMDIRKYGSQGQQRSAALSLKLSEIELVKQEVRDYPVLLLDDVLSELDAKRQEQLLSSIKHLQTIITCTGVEDYINRNLSLNRIIRVTNGNISVEK